MRIDAHQHFWDLTRFAYPWMPAEPSPLRRNHLPEDLAPILRQNRFDGCVTVQATTVDGEADWLLDLADQHKFILGIVAWVDLRAKNLGDRLSQLSSRPKFKGVRHPVHDEEDVRWLLRPDVLEGLRELERRSIPYDLLVRPQHLPVVFDLLERVPDLRVVIDHIAKPDIAAQKTEGWAEWMGRLSTSPKVYVKLSGMVTEADKSRWSPSDLRPYLRIMFECFPPDRLMFGTDWPVCKLANASWRQVLAAFTQAHGAIPAEVRSQMMGETAAAFYRLQMPR